MFLYVFEGVEFKSALIFNENKLLLLIFELLAPQKWLKVTKSWVFSNIFAKFFLCVKFIGFFRGPSNFVYYGLKIKEQKFFFEKIQISAFAPPKTGQK